MTPLFRATKLLASSGYGQQWVEALAPNLARAIQAAVNAERERCAKIAEHHSVPDMTGGEVWIAHHIAAAIRESGNV